MSERTQRNNGLQYSMDWIEDGNLEMPYCQMNDSGDLAVGQPGRSNSYDSTNPGDFFRKLAAGSDDDDKGTVSWGSEAETSYQRMNSGTAYNDKDASNDLLSKKEHILTAAGCHLQKVFENALFVTYRKLPYPACGEEKTKNSSSEHLIETKPVQKSPKNLGRRAIEQLDFTIPRTSRGAEPEELVKDRSPNHERYVLHTHTRDDIDNRYRSVRNQRDPPANEKNHPSTSSRDVVILSTRRT